MNIYRNEKQDAYFKKLSAGLQSGRFPYMGKGSSRVVYDLGNGRVVKAAKNMKGIAQNMVEYQISSVDNSGLFAYVFGASEDYHLLIMEKADPIMKMSYIWAYFHVHDNRQFYQVSKIRDIAVRYNLLIQDLGRVVNWGLIDGNPVIIDYGFTGQVRRRYYRSTAS